MNKRIISAVAAVAMIAASAIPGSAWTETKYCAGCKGKQIANISRVGTVYSCSFADHQGCVANYCDHFMHNSGFGRGGKRKNYTVDHWSQVKSKTSKYVNAETTCQSKCTARKTCALRTKNRDLYYSYGIDYGVDQFDTGWCRF